MKKIKWAVLALVIGYCLNGKTQAIAPFQIHDRVVVSTPTEVFPNIFGVLGGSVSSAAIGKNGTILSIAAFPSTDWQGTSGVALYWRVDFDSGIDGYVKQEHLTKLVDLSPPTAPLAFRAAVYGPRTVYLRWIASRDDVGKVLYSLSRTNKGIATEDTSYIDFEATPGATYTYTLYARDTSGKVSQKVTATVTLPALPIEKFAGDDLVIVRGSAERSMSPAATLSPPLPLPSATPNILNGDGKSIVSYEDVQVIAEGPVGDDCDRYWRVSGGRSKLNSWVRERDLIPYRQFQINDGATATMNKDVQLRLNIDGTGANQFCVTNNSDCSTGCNWQNYVPATDSIGMRLPWALEGSGSVNTVYWKFKKENQIESQCFRESISLDVEKPTYIVNITFSPPSPSASVMPIFRGSISSDVEKVEVFTGNCLGTPIATTCRRQFQNRGMFVPLLPNTTTNLASTVTDGAGNRSVCYGMGLYRGDVGAPTVTLTTKAPPSGAAFGSSISSIFMSGECSAIGQSVLINGAANFSTECRGSISPGSWSATIPTSPLPEGDLNFYVNHRDAAGNLAFPSVFSGLAYSLKKDISGPTGGFLINSGAPVTLDQQVTLNMNAIDVSPVTSVYISELSCSEGGRWLSYNQTIPWTLKQSLGENTVFAVFKDSLGNLSQCFSEKIQKTAAPMFTVDSHAGSAIKFEFPMGKVRFEGRCFPAGYVLTAKSPLGSASRPITFENILCTADSTWSFDWSPQGFNGSPSWISFGFRANIGSNYLSVKEFKLAIEPRPKIEITVEGQSLSDLGGAIDFGSSLPSVVSKKKVVITNRGETNLILSSVPELVSANTNHVMTVSKDPGGLTLTPGASTAIELALMPLNEGSASGQLVVRSNDRTASNGTIQIPVRGQIIPRVIDQSSVSESTELSRYQAEFGPEFEKLEQAMTAAQFEALIPGLALTPFEKKSKVTLESLLLGDKVLNLILANERAIFSAGASLYLANMLSQLGQKPELAFATLVTAIERYEGDAEGEDRAAMLVLLKKIPNTSSYVRRLCANILENLDLGQTGFRGSFSRNGLSYFLAKLNIIYLSLNPKPEVAVPTTFRVVGYILNPIDQNLVLKKLFLAYPELAIKYITDRPQLTELAKRLGFDVDQGRPGDACLSDGFVPAGIKFLPRQACGAGLICHRFACQKPAALGDRCGFDLVSCGSGLQCSGAAGDLYKYCAARAGENHACGTSNNSLNCLGDLECVGSSIQTNFTCRKPAALNNLCGASAGGLSCLNPETVKCIGSTGLFVCTGPASNGEACGSSRGGLDCQLGLTCSGSFTSTMTCTLPSSAGGSCANGQGCTSGLDCVGDVGGLNRTCQTKAALGQFCGASAGGLTCQSTYRCLGGTTGASRCRNLALAGDLCGGSADGVLCDASLGLKCIALTGSTSSCMGAGRNGESCLGGRGCVAGLFCAGEATSARPVCTRLGVVGDLCGVSAGGLKCRDDLKCVGPAVLGTSKCVAPGNLGDSCINGQVCTAGLACTGFTISLNKTCTAKVSVGNICGESSGGLVCQDGLECIGDSIRRCEARANQNQYCGNKTLGYPACRSDLFCEKSVYSLYGICSPPLAKGSLCGVYHPGVGCVQGTTCRSSWCE